MKIQQSAALAALRILLALAMITAFVRDAQATPIQFIHIGTGSGSIGTTTFSNVAFTIAGVGDTSSRAHRDEPDSDTDNTYIIAHTLAVIEISGVGSFQFLSATRTFVNLDAATVGFGRWRSELFGADLFNGPTNAVFSGWDMLSSIGPIAGTGQLLQWSGTVPALTPVITNAGVLKFLDGTSPATFQAIIIPEPRSWCLMLAGLSAIGAWLARSRRPA